LNITVNSSTIHANDFGMTVLPQAYSLTEVCLRSTFRWGGAECGETNEA